MSKSDSSNGPGCAGVVVGALIVWGFVFGVTWNGHHYNVNCTCDRGVVVQ
jgi:hypothetical protein